MIDLLIKYFKSETLEIKLSPTIYDRSTFKNFNSDTLEIRLFKTFLINWFVEFQVTYLVTSKP